MGNYLLEIQIFLAWEIFLFVLAYPNVNNTQFEPGGGNEIWR